MLEQLRAADPSAASHFLEYLILQKRTDVCADAGLYLPEMLTIYPLGSAIACRVCEPMPHPAI